MWWNSAPPTRCFSPPPAPRLEALLSTVPIADTRVIKKRIVLEGNIPSAMNPPPRGPLPDALPLEITGSRETFAKPQMQPIFFQAGGHQIKCPLSDEILSFKEPVIKIAAE